MLNRKMSNQKKIHHKKFQSKKISIENVKVISEKKKRRFRWGLLFWCQENWKE